MIRSIGQWHRLDTLFFKSSLQPHPQALAQVTQTFSFLGLLGSIMGKVRKLSQASKLEPISGDDASRTSKTTIKTVSKKLRSTKQTKFKAKTRDSSGNPSSSSRLSEKVKEMVLMNDTSDEVASSKSHIRDKIGAAEELIKVPSAEHSAKAGSSRQKKKKHVHQGGKEKPPLGSHKQHIKKSVKITQDIPLAVEMPQVIDASDSTLSELNPTLEECMSMDSSDSISYTDSSAAIPHLVSDSSDHNMDDTADIPLAVSMPGETSVVQGNIPLAVVMPGDISVVQGKRRNDKETQLTPIVKKDIVISPDNQGVKSRSADNISSKTETKGSEVSSANVTPKAATSKKVPSHRDKVFENIKVHLVGGLVVLQLVHPVEFFIFGQVEVQVLQGEIQILGYKMDNESGSKVVSSLRGSSFLSIQTVQQKHKSKVPLNLPPDQQNKDTLISLIKRQNSKNVWLLLKEGNQDFLEYIQKYLEYPISLREFRTDEVSPLSQAQEALSCIIQPERSLGKRLNESEEWKYVSHKITQEGRSCTVLCGGKGVGKSTLLRYLVNEVLSNKEAAAKGVAVLDFDPGQAELTPPGCLAASLIKEPLLGPNYSHLQPPERCVYLGEISVTQCLGRYMEAAADIIRYCKESPQLCGLPCIVNTMGFTQGIGVTVMGHLLKLLRPTRVVQIESRRHRDNYPFHLSTANVLSYLNSSDSRCISNSLQLSPSEEADFNYQFILLQSAAEAKSSKDENVWGMKPKTSRNAVILSYFSSLVQPPSYSILDDIPFSCSLGSLFLCVAHEEVSPNLILCAVNGNMVALCSIDPQTSDVLCHQDPSMPRVLTKVPIAPCIGFGIVRGIDMDAKMLYLTTPLRGDKLLLVNCLIFGAVNLPPSVYIKSTAPGLVPYVSTGHHPELSSQV